MKFERGRSREKKRRHAPQLSPAACFRVLPIAGFDCPPCDDWAVCAGGENGPDTVSALYCQLKKHQVYKYATADDHWTCVGMLGVARTYVSGIARLNIEAYQHPNYITTAASALSPLVRSDGFQDAADAQ